MKELTLDEISLLEEMKSNCLKKGQYIDDKAKDKFKMLCHLEDFSIAYYELLEVIKEVREYIDYYGITPEQNDEIEVIEEDKKIKHLSYEETSLWVDDEDGKKPVETIVAINNKELINKINEIIDHINKEDK